MSIKIHKGDYLTFAAIGSAAGVQGLPFEKCQIAPGLWRRHWDIKDSESRSDISREGYYGVTMWAIVNDRMDIMDDIIKTGWKRKWKMGDRGDTAYTSMWPLVPLFYVARYSTWIPTPPHLATPWNNTGYRGHLAALNVMIELLAGKKSWWHKYTVRSLVKANPENPWFRVLWMIVDNKPWDADTQLMIDNMKMEEAAYGWGSCPGEVYAALVHQSVKMLNK